MEIAPEELDRMVRLQIYRHFAESGKAPSVSELARTLDQLPVVVEDSYRRLAAGKAIVLAPGMGNIWMAHPFSGVPTPYRVQTSGGSYWANCAWDALNIAALLGVDAHTEARCPDCNAEVSMVVRSGTLVSPQHVIHFAVPPRHFWENIGFT
jgi:Alkylmercury lyase